MTYSPSTSYVDPEFMRDTLAAYGLRLVRVTDEVVKRADMWHDHYVDSCYIICKEVQVGFYEDREKLIVSVFHEIGHSLIRQEFYNECGLNNDSDTTATWSVACESLAWLLGYKEATERGFSFSAPTLEWAVEQSLSHVRGACASCRCDNSYKGNSSGPCCKSLQRTV